MGQIDRTAFTALVNDSGSNLDGTIWNKTQIQSVLLDPIDNALGQTQLTTVTGAQANFALSTGTRLLRVNNASDVTFSGFLAGVAGQLLIVKPIGAGNVFVKHLSGLSSAANQCSNIATSGDTPIAAGGAATYVYDGTSSLWRLVAHEQGAAITRTFAAGNYTASAGTWTVASAGRDAYVLRGRSLLYAFSASGTTSTTPVTVKIGLPFTAAAVDTTAYYISNSGGGASEGGYVASAASSALLGLQRFANTAFGAGTVSVLGQVSVEVT